MLPLSALVKRIAASSLWSKDLALDVRGNQVIIHELVDGKVVTSFREKIHQEDGLFDLFQRLNDRYKRQTPVVSLLVSHDELGYFEIDPLPAGLKKKDWPFYAKAQYKRLELGELGCFDLINESEKAHLITYSQVQIDIRAQIIKAGFPFVYFYPLPLFQVDQYRKMESSVDAAYHTGSEEEGCLVIKISDITSLYFQQMGMPREKLFRAYQEASLLNPELPLYIWDEVVERFALRNSEVLNETV